MTTTKPILQQNALIAESPTKEGPELASTQSTNSLVVRRIGEISSEQTQPPKESQVEKRGQIENMLKDTKTSIVDKIKSLIPIPASIVHLIDLFLTKKANYDLQAEIADDMLTVRTDVKIPGQGITGTASLHIPLTQQDVQDSMVELHPIIVDFLGKKVAQTQDEQTKEIVKLLSTLPSKDIKFFWSKGSANIIITLPAGVILKLDLAIPSSEMKDTPDFLRAFLKSVLKESYAGIESLLSQDIIFKFDGSASRFDLQFPQQLALHIHELALDNEAFLNFFGKDIIVVIPKTISGIINFKEPSIQFDCSSPFKVKKKVVLFDLTKEFSLTKISFNSTENKIALAFEGLPDRTIDLNKPAEEKTTPDGKNPAEQKTTPEGKNIVNFEVLPYIPKNPLPKKAVIAPVIDKSAKPKISVFETIKKLIPIPPVFLPLIGNLFADQTKLDVKLGVEDNITLSSNVELPSLGIGGKVHLSIPTKMSRVESAPIKLHPEFDYLLSTLIADKVEPNSSEHLMFVNGLILALTLPNQNIHFTWQGGLANFMMTLPGGIRLALELDIQRKSAGKDPLQTKLLEILDSDLTEPYALFTRLLDVLKIVGKNDFRQAELLQILRKEGDKNNLRTQFLKVLKKDILHTKLFEILDSDLKEPFALFTSLQNILNTVGKDDFRRAELLKILRKEGDKNILRTEFLKILEKDILRIKLEELMGEKFASIEPLLGQTFNFNWDGFTKQFSFSFSEQQEINIQSLNLKKDSVLKEVLSGLVGWLARDGVITIPKTIIGNINFEDASVSFEKGTTFTVLGPLGTYKQVSLREVSFGEKNNVGIKLICVGTHDINIDTTTSNVDSAVIRIYSRERPQSTQ